MFPFKRGCCGCSLRTSTQFILYFCLISALYNFFTLLQFEYSSRMDTVIYLSALMALINAIACIFALVDVHKKRTTWLKVFLYVLLGNCIFGVISLLITYYDGSLLEFYMWKVDESIKKERYQSEKEREYLRQAMISLFGAIMWFSLILSFIIAGFFAMVVYSFIVETNTQSNLPIYAVPVEQNAKQFASGGAPCYYYPSAPPPYNPQMNQPVLFPYKSTSIN